MAQVGDLSVTGLLVGTWRLQVFERHTADGNISFPLGRDAVGYLAYTPDGYVFVSIMCRERPALDTPNWYESTPEEKAAAANTINTYCGHYELRGGQIVHHVEQSLFPNNIGTSQVRFMELDGDRLTLTTEPPDRGNTPMLRAVWERAPQRGAADS
jgi:hypothetical protein